MKTLCYGAILWDIFGDTKTIGGAPFNVAAHLAQLGAESMLVTRIGDDVLGKGAFDKMSEYRVAEDFLQVDKKNPTGWAQVTLDSNGKAEYKFPEHPAYEHIQLSRLDIESIKNKEFDAFCFGTLEQKGDETYRSLLKLLEQVKFDTVFFDINIRLNFYPLNIVKESLKHTTIFKINDEELELVSELLYKEKLEESSFVNKLFQDYRLELVCITKGADGCTVYSKERKTDIPGIPVEVVDTVGAGDAFSAAFIYNWINSRDEEKSAIEGGRRGAWVATKQGAVPTGFK